MATELSLVSEKSSSGGGAMTFSITGAQRNCPLSNLSGARGRRWRATYEEVRMEEIRARTSSVASPRIPRVVRRRTTSSTVMAHSSSTAW